MHIEEAKVEFKEMLERNGVKFLDGTVRVPAGKHLGISLLGKIDFFLNHCGFRLVKL